MAEVEKVAVAAPASTLASAATPTATTPAAIAGSINIPTEETLSGSGVDASGIAGELGTSPTQERSSNSHPHDSEYDTASSQEYDEDEDDDDDEESITDEDDDDIEDDDEEGDETDDGRPLGASGVSGDKIDAEAQKKVDEDRRNPQYIPKRGTFYEHDDRTAEVEGDGMAAANDIGEPQEGGSVAGAKSPQSPKISTASKTMKKWLPASAVERWSHDRFEATEQAPKSRTELVTAYGYDIRTEDAPPRARRRRRYTRGPSKYSRNWEDENAYLKASNKERKPPRSSDFPALNERAGNPRKPTSRGTRDEKENRLGKRPPSLGDGEVDDKEVPNSGTRSAYADDRREQRGSEGRGNSRPKSYGRQSNSGTAVGRQAAMEFKQKQRNGPPHNERERQPQRSHQHATGNDQHHNKFSGKGGTHTHQKQTQNDAYNNNNSTNSAGARIGEQASSYQPQRQASNSQQQPMARQQTPLTSKSTPPPSNLSQRLQQVQNRNDPSHVGSVQMHALATQNQLINQQQQQANIMLPPSQQQQPQPPLQQQPQHGQSLPQQEQRGPPKRYSSLRRTQHEAQHMAEQHQLQQMHLQQQQPPPMLRPEQHLMQANLIQLYHQDHLQAQMQALQVGAAVVSPPKPAAGTAYAPVPPTAPPQAPLSFATAGAAPSVAPAAYYVAAPEGYNATAPVQQPPPPSNYMSPAPAASGYTNAPSSQQPVVPVAAPAPPYGPPSAALPAPATTGGTGPPPTAANANPNYPNYQNYNTVGGTTYFVPPAQATARPVVLPQRRPTNAIPILPPAEKNKQQRLADGKDDAKGSGSGGNLAGVQSNAPIGSAENIDHIIDNMFVQRPAFQPPATTAPNPARKSASPPANGESSNGSGGGDGNPEAAVAPAIREEDTPKTVPSAMEAVTNSPAADEESKIGDAITATTITTPDVETNNNPVTAQE